MQVEDDEIETHSLLAMTPAVRVEPLFPPQPTSITLLIKHQKSTRFNTHPEKITNEDFITNHFNFVNPKKKKS